MSAALAWALVAAAILLTGPGSGRRSGGDGSEPRRVRTALSPRVLQVIAAGCVAVGALAVGGSAAGGVAAALLGLPTYVLLGRIAARPSRAAPDASLALGLDLVAAALRSGQSVAAALAVAAPALSDPVATQWQRVAGLLAFGADPEQAWASLAEDPVLAPMAATARRSADSGARLARAFGQLAVETRASRQAAAVARANRAGVLAMAPLGLCFLPAFVCLGIVPTVAGIARDVLGAVP